jgi:acetylornithine deacetylase/succinyl-diaminopimelate desuccinylase-like protein
MSRPDVARLKRDLADLVGLDSQNPPGGEAAVAGHVGRLLAATGLEVETTEYRPGRVNLVGRLANGAGPTFAFNTHMDVVPVGEGWASDPLTLREQDGRLYGRGACDCKGPLAAMIEAIRMLAADRARWSGTLLGVFVGDEEVASEGARRYAASAPKIDFAIVGEPTSNCTVTAHKGSLRPLVRVHGVSAHSSTPDRGDNAIYRAARLISLIEAHHAEVVSKRRHPLVGAASLTITRANAGVADNVMPSRVDLLLDRRMVPGEDEATAKAEIEALLREAKDRFGVRAEVVEYRPTTGGATEIALDRPIVRAALEASRAHGAPILEAIGFQGACDLVHFRAIGAEGVVIGPGDLAVAHKADEFVPLDELVASASLYRDVALAMMPPAGGVR